MECKVKKKNLLIFPAGSEIAFEICNALKYSKFIKIWGGTSVRDHSEFVYENLIEDFPFIDEPNFLEYLNFVIRMNSIDCIYPAHDSVSLFLSEHVDEIDAQVIISDYTTTSVCRSKRETYKFLDDCDFIPIVYDSIDTVDTYPIFVKPEVGQGSKGARKICTQLELSEAVKNDTTLVITEYLPGMEYTVDCFTDKNHELRVVKLRDRARIQNGISVRSQEILVNNEVRKIANVLNERLLFKGAWFFQLKLNNRGEYKLLEISPRIPGTMGLSRNLGINFPMLTLFTFWDFDVNIIDNAYGIILDRAFYNAYRVDISYKYIYVDYDDTIVLNNRVNADLMKFLYQAIDQGKEIILLSKHEGDLFEDMRKHKICETLFDTIIQIEQEDEKSSYISSKDAIFIDDSFLERSKVSELLHIPVFDLDMIESLISWKC